MLHNDFFTFACPGCQDPLEGQIDEIPYCDCGVAAYEIEAAWDNARIRYESDISDEHYELYKDEINESL